MLLYDKKPKKAAFTPLFGYIIAFLQLFFVKDRNACGKAYYAQRRGHGNSRYISVRVVSAVNERVPIGQKRGHISAYLWDKSRKIRYQRHSSRTHQHACA